MVAHGPLRHVIQPSLEGSNINWTNVLSYILFFSFTLPLLVSDTLTQLILVCWLVNLNSNWTFFSRGPQRSEARPAYLTVGSSEGTEEKQEPWDRSLASSCSPRASAAKAPRLMWSICVVCRLSCQHREHRGPHPRYTQMTPISHPTSVHLTPSDHIHISYETTQEKKTPKATSRCT